jgi:hypothetical protein
LNPPCIRNPTSYGPFDFLDVNPLHPIGGEALPDAECSKPVRQDLFESSDRMYIAEDATINKVLAAPEIRRNLAAEIQTVEAGSRSDETFKLDAEQERKLKSLGYLR